MTVRVLVVAQDPLLRSRLAELLADRPDCAVVAEGPPEDLERLGPPADIAVFDLGADPAAARDQLAAHPDPGIPLVVLGPPGLTADALAAGARGYLGRDLEGARLAAALHAAAQGLQVMEPGRAVDASPEDLTPRELEVLHWLAEGLPNKEIARALRISEHTVKFHVDTILSKLGARTRTEAVTRAARRGLIIL